jgi:hypothetical protein
MDQQGTEAIWLLDLWPAKGDAIAAEALLAWGYRVPTLQFSVSASERLSQGRQDAIWRELDSETGALLLLAAHGRRSGLPLLLSRRVTGVRRLPIGSSRRYEVAAANLMGGYMTIPTDPGTGQTPAPMPFTLGREPFAGDVYSLDVEPHRHYVSSGAIVQSPS